MFFSYFLAGMVPIAPTVVFNQPEARLLSIGVAFAGLLTVGYVKGRMVEEKALRSAVELFAIGAVATSIGLIVGQVLRV